MRSNFRTLLNRFCPALLLAWVLALHTDGQAQEPKKNGPSAPEPWIGEVHFTDGGLLKLTLLEEQIEIMTSAGKKTVRLADLHKVELALRLSEDESKAIETAIRALGSKSFREREKASADLLRRGLRAYPALLAAIKDGDPETRRRATLIVDNLKGAISEDLFEARTADVLHVKDGKLTGKINQESWKVSTTQFGVVQMKLADVAKMVSLTHPDPILAKLVPQADPGNMTALQGQVGVVFAFRVTGAVHGSVWGTGTYTSDSTLATAAVHAGLLKVGQTGIVKVQVVPAQGAYQGSTQNGVTSSPYGPWHGSYQFIR